MKRIVFLLVAFTMLLAACAPASPLPSGEGQGEGAQPAATNPPVATDAPTVVAGAFDINNWDSVLAAAKGQTVNWYIWGGSDSINAFVDNFYAKALKER
jgi:hypothetical protein